jgi:hypothetical protein
VRFMFMMCTPLVRITLLLVWFASVSDNFLCNNRL